MGHTPGGYQETAVIADEPGEVNAGDGVEGVGAGELATGSSSTSGCLVVSVTGCTFVCCQKWSIKSMRSNIQEGQAVKPAKLYLSFATP